jgi:glycosyltransferase involved in cell wall biosynthesis
MKIIYLVHQYFPRHVGGTEMYVRGLARRARECGHDPLVVTHVESSDTRPSRMHLTCFEDMPVVEILSNYSQSSRPGRDEYADPRVGDLLEALLREQSPDLVHVAHTMKLGATSMRRCEKLGIPMIVTLCDFWFICPRHTLLRSDGQCCAGPTHARDCLHCMRATHPESSFRVYTQAAAMLARPWHRLVHWHDLAKRPTYLRRRLLASRRIIALSAFAMRMHIANGIPESRITLLPHGLEALPGHTVPDSPPERLHIVFIGSLVPHKGAHVLLAALSKIPQAPLRCSIYGAVRPDDPYNRQLLDLAAKDRRITLAGTFPPEDLWNVLDSASILALPALWYENAPLVVKAALHRGIPVLASALGSLTDQIQHGRNGWLCPAGDADAIAGMLAVLADQPGQCRFPPSPDAGMDTHARHVFSLYGKEIHAHEPSPVSG